MAISPEPFTGGNVYKLTTMINLNIQGWSESYYAWMAGEQLQKLTMESASQKINIARRAALVSVGKMAGQRIESVSVKRDAFVKGPPDLSLGYGTNVATAAGPWDGWLVRISDISGQVWDNRIYTGWDQVSVDYIGTVAAVGQLPPKVSAFLSKLEQALTTVNTTKDGLTWRYAIKSYDRTSGVSPIVAVVTIALNAQGRVVLTALDPTLTIRPGMIVQLNVPRKRCVRGLSGRARVLSVVVGSSNVITLDKKFCCNEAELVGMIGTVRAIVPAYYPIDTVEAIRVVKRDRGRAFFATAGRRRARCC